MGEIETERIRTLEILVDELIKDSPQEDIIKESMQRVGLSYKEDPVDRLNMVLEALDFRETKDQDGKNKKSI